MYKTNENELYQLEDVDSRMINDNHLEQSLSQQYLLLSNLRSPSPNGVDEMERNKNKLSSYVRETVLQENFFFSEQIISTMNYNENDINMTMNNYVNNNDNDMNNNNNNNMNMNMNMNISQTLNQVLTDKNFWEDLETMIEETFSRST